MKTTRKVCVIQGDDASPEVVTPVVRLLERMKLPIRFSWPVTGDEALALHGDRFPLAARQAIDEADCAIMGSTRRILGVHAYLRWGKQCYANIRPSYYFRGVRSPLRDPEGIDFVIMRENLEGLYPAAWEGEISRLKPLGLYNESLKMGLDSTNKGLFAIKITTEDGVKRICRSACDLAMQRKRSGGAGKVTVCSKYNALSSDEMFRRIAEETCAEYPGLTFESMIIDNFAQQMILYPKQLDVVVTSNEYGDIMADGAAALVGGLGIAPNACVGDHYAYFGTVHGTAPDIAGLNVINPTAMLLGAAMMLKHLDLAADARRLESAVYSVYEEGTCLTRDQGGSATTTEFCECVAARGLG